MRTSATPTEVVGLLIQSGWMICNALAVKCHLSTVLTVAGAITTALIHTTYQLSVVTVRYVHRSVTRCSLHIVSKHETQFDEASQGTGSVTCEDLPVATCILNANLSMISSRPIVIWLIHSLFNELNEINLFRSLCRILNFSLAEAYIDEGKPLFVYFIVGQIRLTKLLKYADKWHVWSRCVDLRSVRLIGASGNPRAGRLEINYNGIWGTVCNHYFDNNDANVACYMLGVGYLLYFYLVPSVETTFPRFIERR